MNIDSYYSPRLIKESRNKFRSLIDGIDDEIFPLDNDFIITSVNQALARSLGTHPRNVVGRYCYEALFDTHVPCRNDSFTCPVLLARESSQLETALQMIEEDGAPTKYLELRAIPVQNDQGGVDHVILLRRDITAQKTTEQQSRDYNERLAEDISKASLQVKEGGQISPFNPKPAPSPH